MDFFTQKNTKQKYGKGSIYYYRADRDKWMSKELSDIFKVNNAIDRIMNSEMLKLDRIYDLTTGKVRKVSRREYKSFLAWKLNIPYAINALAAKNSTLFGDTAKYWQRYGEPVFYEGLTWRTGGYDLLNSMIRSF